MNRLRLRFAFPGRWLARLALGLPLAAILARADTTLTTTNLTSLYAALLGGGHITFNLANNATFTLVAPLDIQRDTILDASASAYTVTFTGSDKVRLLNVNPGVRLELRKLVLTHGSTTNAGAVFNDRGTLVATNCTFSSNSAVGVEGAEGAAGADDINVGGNAGSGGGGGIAVGGAVWNLGEAQFLQCRFEANSAAGGNGGEGGVGGSGALQGGNGGNGGSAGAGLGGAIYSTANASLVLSNCTFKANVATGGAGGAGGLAGSGPIIFPGYPGNSQPGGVAFGGAIYSLGTSTVFACTFNTNRVTGGAAAAEFEEPSGFGSDGQPGGGAAGGGFYNGGKATLVNCTFAADGAQGGAGGNGGASAHLLGGAGGDGGTAFGAGLWNQGVAYATNCTFVAGVVVGGEGGTAGTSGDRIDPGPPDGSVGYALGGDIANNSTSGSVLLLRNCLVANAPYGGNAVGPITDFGGNLSSDNTCHFTALTSLNSTDPLVGALGDYGGPTQTVPILLGSPAINGGGTVDWLTLDQRGVTRPQGSAYDIGAYERVFTGLSGQVTTGKGAALPGVVITLLSATSQPKTTASDADGHYEFSELVDANLGVYRVVAPAGGAGYTPPYYDVQLSSTNDSRTNLNFVANGALITSYGFNDSGQFSLSLLGEPSTAYRVQAADAIPASWQTIGQGTTDAAGVLSFTDSTASTTGQRWYQFVTP